ncbi:prostaglandin D2 receptor 2 [Microcaecilia unicolor]|uniref:Prostaglandin D2 receptor 2-like n=1 Tax=Microcaecilia unicolor TaxID=1415580 RepID=A0A6P7WSF8_9AMPH|nr:prostaglandin D2 receptor 2-like [Microcaecilia unicolor]
MNNGTRLCSIIQDMVLIPPHLRNSTVRYIDYASVTVHGLASLFGVVENVLIIFVIGFKMRRTVITTWMLNLALSDFMTSVSLPFFTYFLAKGHTWELGTFFCRVHSSVFFLNMFISSFILSAISLDRCLLVLYPVWAQNHRTVPMSTAICVILWILAILNTVPYYLFRDTIQRQDGRIMCYYNFLLYSNPISSNEDNFALCSRRQYAVAVSKFLISFFVPLLLIAICYTAVSLKIRRRHQRNSRRFFKLMVAIILTFVLCWFPYHIFSLMEAQAHHQKEMRQVVWKALPFVTSLAFINSILNPCLYVFTCPDFLSKIRHSLKSVLESVLVEDEDLFSRRGTIRSTASFSRDCPLLHSHWFSKCNRKCSKRSISDVDIQLN